ELGTVAKEIVFERLDPGPPAFIGSRVRLSNMPGNRIHVGLCLLNRDARLEPAHDHQPMKVVIALLRRENQRRNDLPWKAVGLAGTKNTDDGVWLLIEHNLFADDVRIGPEALPEAIREDDDAVLTGDSFFRKEAAAKMKRHAQHTVHAGSGVLGLDHLRRFLAGHVETGPAEGHEILEYGGLLLPIEKVARRNDIAKSLNFGPDDHQLIGVRIGHGSDERGVDDGEDRRGGADAQREGQNDSESKARALDQHAQTEAKMMKRVSHWLSQSIRSAFMGSMDAARRAGTNPATAAHSPSTKAAPPMAHGSPPPN